MLTLYALMYQLETDERKNGLGCSWDVRDAQDAFKTDPSEQSVPKWLALSRLHFVIKCFHTLE